MTNARPAPGGATIGVALAVAVLAVSCAAIFFRLATPTHPVVMAGTRLTIAAVVFALPTIRSYRRGTFTGRHARAAVFGGLWYALHFGTWVTSLTLTTVAASVTLVTATPILLGIIALVTGTDRPSPRTWASLGVVFLGLLVLGVEHGTATSRGLLVGDVLALVGAAAMAGYMLLVRAQGETLDAIAFSGVAIAVGAVTLMGWAWVMGVPWEIPSARAGFWILMAALVPQLIGHTTLTWSLRHLPPTGVAIAAVSEPVVSTMLGVAILGESVSPVSAVGCGLTLLGVAIFASGVRRATPGSPAEDPGMDDT